MSEMSAKAARKGGQDYCSIRTRREQWLIVHADGWVEDRTGKRNQGFWIRDLDVSGGVWLALILKEGEMYRRSLFGGAWTPTGVPAPPEKKYALLETQGEILLDFWSEHKPETLSSQPLASDRSERDLPPKARSVFK